MYPQQIIRTSTGINISLKYPQITSNAGASRFVAYTGNAVVNTSTGNYAGGRKIKDLMFKQTKTAGFSTCKRWISSFSYSYYSRNYRFWNYFIFRKWRKSPI